MDSTTVPRPADPGNGPDLFPPLHPVALPTRYRVKVLNVHVVREPQQATRKLKASSPEEAAAVARQLIPDDDREHFGVLCLDSQNGVNGYHEVSVGSLSASIVHPREVFRAAILWGAAHLIIVHNHPSGDPTPSKEDVALTRQLAEGARLLGIKLHDHVIIGNGTDAFASLSQRGLI
jgi:DNA repair protein RadC